MCARVVHFSLQTKEIEFPDCAVVFGFFYTESVLSTYAFHPEGREVRGHKTWNFFSCLMHEFIGVISANPRKRLDMFQAAMVVKNHARRFGKLMKQMLEAVLIVEEDGLKIKREMNCMPPIKSQNSGGSAPL